MLEKERGRKKGMSHDEADRAGEETKCLHNLPEVLIIMYSSLIFCFAKFFSYVTNSANLL